MEKRIDTNETPHVMLQACRGNVTIGSWTRWAVTVTGEDFTCEAPEANLITITAASDVEVMLPAHSRLTIEDVHGNLAIKNVSSLIKIGQVAAKLSLKNVGNLQVDAVAGPLQGEGISGPLTIGEGEQPITLRSTHDVIIRRAQSAVSIHYTNGRVALEDAVGDVALHTISGDVSINRAGGNVTLSNLGGQNKLPEVQGTIFLAGGLVSGEHSFTAGENIFVYWPRTAPLNLIATAATIANRLPLQQPVESAEDEKTTLTGYIENRKTFLILKAGDRIGLTTWDAKEVPQFVESDFDIQPEEAVVQPAAPVAATAPDVATAVSQAVTKVINRIELDLGPEWGRRFAALELEEKFTEAINDELAGLQLAPHPENDQSGLPPSAGGAAFARAEEKVEKSLQQATETMEKARQGLAGQEAAAAPADEAPEPVPDRKTTAEKKAEAAGQEETAVAVATTEESPIPPLIMNDGDPPSRTAAQLRILDLLEKALISVEEASKLLQSL